MNNQQLIKSAHIWFLTVLLACGLWAVAGKAGISIQDQNSNQNGNSNSNNSNGNTNANTNANRSQNSNANNRNSGTTAGEQTGMSGMSSKDRDFVMDVAMGGLMEVELGRLAAQQGTSEAVKQFGQRMVDDHTAANTELMTLATSKGLTLPTSLDAKHQKDVTKLSAMSGAEFDRAYSKMMLKDHQKHVSEFEKQSMKAADPDVKAFAAKTLPTLQEHLQMARALSGNNAGGGARSTNRNMNDNGNMNANSNRNSNGNSNRNRNGNSNNGNSNNSNRP